MSGNSLRLESVETIFNQDLNGDGVIGLTQTVIQTDTNRLDRPAWPRLATNIFSITAAASGPALKYGGAAVTAGEFGAWTPIGAVQTATGYDVAWKIPGANEYTMWNTDSNGNYISNIIGAGVGNQPDAWSRFETTFNQDLNGDGVIGLTTDGDPDRH